MLHLPKRSAQKEFYHPISLNVAISQWNWLFSEHRSHTNAKTLGHHKAQSISEIGRKKSVHVWLWKLGTPKHCEFIGIRQIKGVTLAWERSIHKEPEYGHISSMLI